MKHFDITMRRAFILLAALVVILFGIQVVNSDGFSPLNLAMGFCLDIIWAVVIIYSIKVVKEYCLESGMISTWGFVWRSLLAKYIALYLSVFIFMLLPVKFELPSIEYTFFMYTVAIFTSFALAWVFFSENRGGQLRWVFELVRGY